MVRIIIIIIIIIITFMEGKGKGFPLQAWNGSWGSRGLRLLDLFDFRHCEGGKVVTLTHRPSLPPGVFLVLIFSGWVDPRVHGSVGILGKNSQLHHWGSIPRPSGLVAQCLNHYATPGPPMQWVPDIFSGGVALTTHHHLAPRLKKK